MSTSTEGTGPDEADEPILSYQRPPLEEQFLRQIKRSHRFAVVLLLGPLLLIVALAYFSSSRISKAQEPVRAINQALQGVDGKDEAGKVFTVLAQLKEERTAKALLVDNTHELEERIMFLEGATVSGATGAPCPSKTTDTGPERCGLSRPHHSAFVFFGLGNADTTPSIEAHLDDYLEKLQRAGATGALTVHGYADGLGTADVNRQVSLRRAQAVATYLAAHRSKPSLTFHSEGHGNACVDPDRTVDLGDPCQRLVVVVPRSTPTGFRQLCSRKGTP